MRSKTKYDIPLTEKRLLSIKEAAAYLGMGTQRAKTYCETIGADRHFGRSVLFDRFVIDQALNSLSS